MSSNEKPLVNRVANSGIITLDLEQWYPSDELVHFDIKDYLFQGLILKEKDFRTALKELDWSDYQDKILLVYCSADAIVPSWAYMLIASYATKFAKDVVQASSSEYLNLYYREHIAALDLDSYEDKRVVIKGCSKKDVPVGAYLELTKVLQPRVKSLMFGEPCSTVPVYKKPKV